MNNQPFFLQGSSTEIPFLSLLESSIPKNNTLESALSTAVSGIKGFGDFESLREEGGNMAWWPNPSVLEQLAVHPGTPATVLEQLAWHPVADVRASVAENANTPLESIFALAQDNDPHVRYQLAENHKLNVAVLNLLSNDEHPYVACRARRTLDRLNCQ
jgi:hypothetical protein